MTVQHENISFLTVTDFKRKLVLQTSQKSDKNFYIETLINIVIHFLKIFCSLN